MLILSKTDKMWEMLKYKTNSSKTKTMQYFKWNIKLKTIKLFREVWIKMN